MPFVLPAYVQVVDVADTARVAWVDFLALPDQAKELARWWDGPYRTAIGFVRAAGVRTGLLAGPVMALTSAQQRVLGVIRTLDSAPSLFIDLMPARRHVVAITDVNEAFGFAPTGSASLHLHERVLVLALADLLTRPSAFASFTREHFGHGRR